MPAQWCDAHEVYDRCHEPKPPPAEPTLQGGFFRRGPLTRKAEFDSPCPGDCGEFIEQGDDIAWSERLGMFVHKECL